MTFSNMADLKKPIFQGNIGQNEKFAKKAPNIAFFLIKEGNGVSNMFFKFQDNTKKDFFF